MKISKNFDRKLFVFLVLAITVLLILNVEVDKFAAFNAQSPKNVVAYENFVDFSSLTLRQKIAQMLIQPIHNPEIEEVKELDNTVRGEGGFGSSGAK